VVYYWTRSEQQLDLIEKKSPQYLFKKILKLYCEEGDRENVNVQGKIREESFSFITGSQ